ncbi:tetratricopeptide repeat protein [Litoreibacter albidus]|uniref:TPR repeat-containing protein n=1 Tax=Litoreibacter albidus TaxID=670155 RepID=A0A1H2R5A4_9RHOB|nr:tetratricopeptide repeat protein [Litoreibacter albidus]SDW14531.1 TPR repeat-containing protein [Litoreibacter albidus]
MHKWVGAVAVGLILAGCEEKTATLAQGDSPFPPTGDVTRLQSVDGLAVGHRLMAAGQFELALKAYLRAAGEQGTTVDVLSALGSVNLRLGRLGQSEQLLRRAIKTDQTFVPAWNNLGVVLMDTGRVGEASRVFKTAFALDSGKSDEIRENLRRALAKIENPAYTSEKDERAFDLVRRGNGRYLLLQAP